MNDLRVTPPAGPGATVSFSAMRELLIDADRLHERFRTLERAMTCFRAEAPDKVRLELSMGMLTCPLHTGSVSHLGILRLLASDLRHDIDELIGALARHHTEPPAWIAKAVAVMDGWNRSSPKLSTPHPAPPPPAQTNTYFDTTGSGVVENALIDGVGRVLDVTG